jgi:hypothetical protein
LQPVVVEVQPPNGDNVSQPSLQVSEVHAELMWQVMSHAHARPQTTLLHESRPLQSTLQGPVPQETPWQLCLPSHVIVQALPPVQLMPLLHAPLVEHAMSQLQPIGQVTSWLHAPLLSAQSIVHILVSALHDVHPDGHLAPSPGGPSGFTPASTGITQNPSLQVRPARQSDCCVHAKSLL